MIGLLALIFNVGPKEVGVPGGSSVIRQDLKCGEKFEVLGDLRKECSMWQE